MPRKFDKYGFNRQYLRRPCTRANPFPYRIPFDNGFSTRTLLYTMVTRPSTKVKSNVLAASVTRSGKEFKGEEGTRMKLLDVAEKALEREGELQALVVKSGELAPLVEVLGQDAIIIEAVYNSVHKRKRPKK
jgi:hypothetical protein